MPDYIYRYGPCYWGYHKYSIFYEYGKYTIVKKDGDDTEKDFGSLHDAINWIAEEAGVIYNDHYKRD